MSHVYLSWIRVCLAELIVSPGCAFVVIAAFLCLLDGADISFRQKKLFHLCLTSVSRVILLWCELSLVIHLIYFYVLIWSCPPNIPEYRNLRVKELLSRDHELYSCIWSDQQGINVTVKLICEGVIIITYSQESVLIGYAFNRADEVSLPAYSSWVFHSPDGTNTLSLTNNVDQWKWSCYNKIIRNWKFDPTLSSNKKKSKKERRSSYIFKNSSSW